MLHIDGDALVYIAGFSADSRNGKLSHSLHNCKLIINAALKNTNQSKFKILLTHTDSAINFRYEISPNYKGNRKKKCAKCKSIHIKKTGSWVQRTFTNNGIFKRRLYKCLDCQYHAYDTKPVYYKDLRKYLVEQYGAKIVKWGEADDWLHGADIIATHDKDIYQLPIPIYNLKSKEITVCSDPGEIYLLTKEKSKVLKGYGFKWFCIQMLLGDKIDNIEKPYAGDGPVWIHKIFNPLKTPNECWQMVKMYYTMVGRKDLLEINSKLLWVARKSNQIFNEGLVDEIEE